MNRINTGLQQLILEMHSSNFLLRTMLNVNFEAMNIKEQIKEILIKHYHFVDCDDVVGELLNLHSVSNCEHEWWGYDNESVQCNKCDIIQDRD